MDGAGEAVCSTSAPGPTHLEGHERRTQWVVGLTAVMMVAELVVGWMTRSLALTADGWHMATHVGALGLSVVGYWFARTRARDARFTFGTGKVYALAGYTSAASLVVVALAMVFSALHRFFDPVDVHFAEALPVALLGLVVNLVSAKLLAHGHSHGGGEHGGHGHANTAHGTAPHAGHVHALGAHRHGECGHSHDAHGHEHGAHGHGHSHGTHEHGHGAHSHGTHEHGAHGHAGHEHVDHNLRAAYLHVVADALTSVLAIAALLCGRYLGWSFLDPVAALVGGAFILHWGVGLCRDSAARLLDVTPSPELVGRVRQALESLEDTRVVDLHLWDIAPGRRSCMVALASATPLPLEAYRACIQAVTPVDHLTVQVEHPRPHAVEQPGPALATGS